MDAIRDSLYPPGLPNAWNAVPCIENHDLVYSDRENRIPSLADGSNSRSFYATSRSKVATGLLLAAPGIPQLFMGQEFLEDKQWNENPAGSTLGKLTVDDSRTGAVLQDFDGVSRNTGHRQAVENAVRGKVQ